MDEATALADLRALVGTDDAQADDAALLRFLRARELRVPAAHAMVQKWQAWRADFGVDGITEANIAAEAATGKAYWWGHDRQRRACVVIRPRLHWPGKFSTEDSMRFAAFMMETGVKKTEALGSEKICVIYDREGMTRQNIDFSMFGVLQSLLGMVQDFYAERLGAVYVLHANWLYHAIFGMLKPFLTERTKSKMKLLGSPAELGEYFELDQLPEYYREACERGGALR